MNKVFYIIIILTAFLLLLSCSVRRNIPYKTYDFSERKEPVFWAGAPYRFNETEKEYLYVKGKWKADKCSKENILEFHQEIGNHFDLKCTDGNIFHRGTIRFLERNFALLYCFENKSEKLNCNCLYYTYYPEGEKRFKEEFRKRFSCKEDRSQIEG